MISSSGERKALARVEKKHMKKMKKNKAKEAKRHLFHTYMTIKIYCFHPKFPLPTATKKSRGKAKGKRNTKKIKTQGVSPLK